MHHQDKHLQGGTAKPQLIEITTDEQKGKEEEEEDIDIDAIDDDPRSESNQNLHLHNRGSAGPSQANLARTLTTSQTMFDDAFDQITRAPSPSVLDNTAEIVIQYGYIMLFVIVFPLMPLMALVNNWAEFRLDFYNMIEARRCVPFAAPGEFSLSLSLTLCYYIAFLCAHRYRGMEACD